MGEDDRLDEHFETHRVRLRAVAYRMLGSTADADDALQEAWLRFARTDIGSVGDVGAWLTTVVSRLCLNMLQSRRSRPVPTGTGTVESTVVADGAGPEDEALLADSVDLALVVVLDRLSPAERVAFVLHDTFAVPFEEIATILGRSTPATRQLASRARRGVEGQGSGPGADLRQRSRLVDAFLAAARRGDFAALIDALDPDVVRRADPAATRMGVAAETNGPAAVGEFCRRLGGAHPALVNGHPGAVWMPGGEPRVVITFRFTGEKITRIDLIGEPAPGWRTPTSARGRNRRAGTQVVAMITTLHVGAP